MTLDKTCMLAVLAGAMFCSTVPALASEASDLDAMVHKWAADMNVGNMKAFYDACAPRVAIVDGFPPYAWHTCQDWMRDYEANNRRIKAARGTLLIGSPLWIDVQGDRAVLNYSATFTHVQDGKTVTYKGMWAVSLVRTKRGWLITGSGSAWGSD
ncbi:hypothetical protein [Sphingomonas sp. LT1P40]|uniref:hypothetical protein n=1 Tax=Alteristakelama amylovorans TaxID=3096166 RepID=UPI002FCAF5E9